MSDISAEELPSFQRWRDQFVPPSTTSGYLERETTLLSAILFAELAFPILREVRGCVVRADSYSEVNFARWWQTLGGDREAVERVTNLLPLGQYFEPADEVEERALGTIAERIAVGWRTQAALRFPDRSIVVELVTDLPDDGPGVLMYTWRGVGSVDTLPAPRVQEFDRYVDRETGAVRVQAGLVRPASPDEIVGLG